MQDLAARGAPLDRAVAVMILVHGRGGSAANMLSLVSEFDRAGWCYLAPEAAGGTWYPFSFLAPLEQNEPHLSRALGTLGRVLESVTAARMPERRVVLLGFSQGACLTLEFAARNPRRYGAVVALSGGLIGPPGTPRDYQGSLAEAPVLLGCSDVDPHVPLERVRESAAVFRRLGATVDERVYPGFGHSVNRDEIDAVRALLASVEGEDPNG
jgi:predicted esterase